MGARQSRNFKEAEGSLTMTERLQHTTQAFVEATRSSMLIVTNGIIQGDALLPMLFILCMAPNNQQSGMKRTVPLVQPFNGKFMDLNSEMTHQFYVNDLTIFQ